MPKIFVVILNWNGFKDTINCLESLQKTKVEGFKLQVVLVDNGSTDDSLQEIEKRKFKNLKIISLGRNLGFAGGNNVGINYSLDNAADYICLLNNDTEVSKTLVMDLLKFANNHPNAGAISPKIYFYKGFEFHKGRYKKNELGKVIWYGGGKIDWRNVYGSNAHVDEVDTGELTDYQTDFATGACVFIPASCLKKVGLFNEKYFLYLEDVELSMRLKRAGYEIWFANTPLLWHKVSQSSSIGSNLNDYFITRNRLAFGMKYAPLRAKIALIRESVRFLFNGRAWQRRGVTDFYLKNFGIGSWK